jgi:uncharacterized DUF497 family protein
VVKEIWAGLGLKYNVYTSTIWESRVRLKLFVWNAHNIEHVLRHAVHPDEVDEALEGEHRTVTTHSGRYMLLGRSGAGRYLSVIYEPLREGRGLVITARDMSHSERRRYLKLL